MHPRCAQNLVRTVIIFVIVQRRFPGKLSGLLGEIYVGQRLLIGFPSWYALSNFGIGWRILGMVVDFLHIKAFYGLEVFELLFWGRSLKF